MKRNVCFFTHINNDKFTVINGNATRSNSSTKTLYCPIRGNVFDGDVVCSLKMIVSFHE